jgi:transposase
MTQPLSPETLAQLNRSIAEEVAKAKPQFYKLEQYREFIQAQIEAGATQRAILRVLKKEQGLDVSPDTFSRYVRVAGFRPEKSARRKRRKTPAKATV